MPDLSLSALRRDYLSGRRTPRCVIEDTFDVEWL